MRKLIILVVIIVLSTAAVAVASWQVSGWIRGDKDVKAPGNASSAGTKAQASAAGQTAENQVGEAAGGGEEGEAGAPRSGETSQYDNPDLRYVSETQRHQNFFNALAEGRVKRLEVTATDFQPAGDPDSSYVYVIIATTDGARSDGSIVMMYEEGLWRIGAVKLTGGLAGGTSYSVPSSFEDDLARELREQQDFLKKMAEGRLAYMSINSVNRTGEGEVVLTGEVGSKGGTTYPSEMRLGKDYGIWHLTNISAL